MVYDREREPDGDDDPELDRARLAALAALIAAAGVAAGLALGLIVEWLRR